MNQSLAQRVVLITGAGSGLGRQAALACAAQGATVLLLGRNEARLNALYDQLVTEDRPQPVVIPFDLKQNDESRFQALSRMIEAELGRLDALVHSAVHFVKLAPLAQQTLAHWHEAIATNLLGPFALTKACLPLLQQAPDASVLFTVEQHGLQPAAYWGGFAISQAAVVAMARTWADEHTQNSNLRFNVLVPGPVATTTRNRTHPGEARSELRAPQDLAGLYAYWLGPASRGRNGEIIYP